eukprot:scaffold6320_cov153-Pinguiococcus_pyrenoidosus.AAC.1
MSLLHVRPSTVRLRRVLGPSLGGALHGLLRLAAESHVGVDFFGTRSHRVVVTYGFLRLGAECRLDLLTELPFDQFSRVLEEIVVRCALDDRRIVAWAISRWRSDCLCLPGVIGLICRATLVLGDSGCLWALNMALLSLGCSLIHRGGHMSLGLPSGVSA